MPNLAANSVVQLPGLGRRFASMTYECLLLLGVLAASFMVPHLALGMGFGVMLPGWILLCHIFAVLGAYFIWYWSHGGQTLAMQTWNIALTLPNGRRPSTAQLGLRYLLAWPSIALFGIGLAWALLDRDRQFLHDRLAGTRIGFSTDRRPDIPV